jgi:hypothetical protein
MKEKLNGLSAAAPLLKTEPQQYREAVANVTERARIRYEQAKKDGKIPEYDDPKGIRKAYDGFFEAIAPASKDGTVDYDKQEALAVDYLGTLDNGTRERILKELTFSPDNEYRGLLEARQQLKPYFEIRDQVWEAAREKNSKLADYESEDAFVDAKQAELMERRIPRDEARDMATELASVYTGIGRDKQEIYLLKNRDMLQMLHKYGYYIPADLKDLAAIPAR